VHFARRFWQRIETIHAVTYFAPESIEAAKDAGLRGFWMGYFGFRAAPLGAVSAAVVDAVFAGFAPSMVRRSVPDAWTFADPGELVRVRAAAAARALIGMDGGAESVASFANDELAAIASEAGTLGRPLFAANRDVVPLDDPVQQLWQHCTTLREHRGDGHVLALAAEGIDGCEAHRLLLAREQVSDAVLFDNRGWSTEEWQAAAGRLTSNGLLDRGRLTGHGHEVKDRIEATTDRLALEPIASALGEDERERLLHVLTPLAVAVVSSNVLPFPNPMGLPRLGPDPTGG
jgi:hypothetical protein